MRARRYARGLATLKDLKGRVESGQGVRDEDIPPPVSIKQPQQQQQQQLEQQQMAHQQQLERERLQQQLEQQRIQQQQPMVQQQQMQQQLEQLQRLKEQQMQQQLEQQQMAQQQQLEQERMRQQQLKQQRIQQQQQQMLQHFPAPVEASQPKVEDSVTKLHRERDRYKEYALKAKARGDREAAIAGLKGVKLCDELIKKGGVQEGDLGQLLPKLPPADGASARPAPQLPPAQPQLQRAFSRDDPIQVCQRKKNCAHIIILIFFSLSDSRQS